MKKRALYEEIRGKVWDLGTRRKNTLSVKRFLSNKRFKGNFTIKTSKPHKGSANSPSVRSVKFIATRRVR